MANIESTDVAGVFQQLVLEHLNKLDEADWQRFRQFPLSIPEADRGRDWTEPAYRPNATRQELVQDDLFYINIRPADYTSIGDHIEIAEINDQPLYYFPTAGIYAWSSASQPRSTIMISLTWPAEPPGW